MNFKILLGVNIVFLIICVSFLVTKCDTYSNTELETELQSALEHAYFEGQRDYAEGDIRIQKNSDDCWEWYKSPWDNDLKPIYKPECE